jgi:hypothetical protein
MKTFKRITVACLVISGLFWSSPAFSQTAEPESEPVKRTIGLSANVQNSEFGINVPIFLTQRFSLAPAIGLRYAEGVRSDYALAIVPKLYYSTNKFAPYSTLRLGILINNPKIGQTTSQDYLAGIGTGAEYFFVPNFSFGVEAQLNGAFSDETSNRFGNPGGVNINLATVVTANIYFTK